MAVAEDASKKKYAHLDQLSTEELKAILRASALSEEADDPALIDYVLEVIMQREKEQCYSPDVGQAQKEFDQFYRDLESPLYSAADIREEATTSDGANLNISRKKKQRVRYAVIAVAVIAVLVTMTCIPVFGYANVVQMVIAYWTDDYFTFREKPQDLEEKTQNEIFIIPEGFEDLWDIANQNGIQNLMIPQYIPDGFRVADSNLNIFADGVVFCVLYTKDEDYISIDIIKDGKGPRTIYEKDENEPIICQLNETEYCIFTNNGESTSALYLNDIEYSYETTLPAKDLEKIINSMI